MKPGSISETEGRCIPRLARAGIDASKSVTQDAWGKMRRPGPQQGRQILGPGVASIRIDLRKTIVGVDARRG